MYKLKLTRREKNELALGKWIVSGLAILGLAAVVWLAWVRPTQQSVAVSSYSECKAAGNRIQESYPEVCLTPEGKRFVNPEQNAAHSASLAGITEPVMPNDPSLLYLDIKEWDIRVPLTEKTFDLLYLYSEDGLVDRVKLTYKRLVNAGLCTGDVGVTMSRLAHKGEPPYNVNNPAPIAQVGTYYYYLAYGGSPCYDPENAAAAELVKKIAGDQSLAQATGALLAKLEALSTP